jgi:drug/metabolite transporter (DMT)-like permease
MYATLYPLMLVFYLYFHGVAVSFLEWAGVLVAVGGILITSISEGNGQSGVSSFDIKRSNNLDSTSFLGSKYILGDIICLLSSVCETLVIVNRQKTRAYVPVMQVKIVMRCGVHTFIDSHKLYSALSIIL